MRNFMEFLLERWRARRLHFAFYLVSPTLLFADYRKYSADRATERVRRIGNQAGC